MRLSILGRWVAVPLRDPMVFVALVTALAVPSFLVASADHWTTAAADEATVGLLADASAGDLGVVVQSEAVFAGDAVIAAADDVVGTLTDDPRLDAPVRTLTTFRALGLVGPELDPIGVPLRIVARPGAIESLTVVAGDPDASGGVWISAWLAEDTGLGPGDTIVFESSLEPEDPGAEAAIGGGPAVALTIDGVYATLWDVEGAAPPPYWREAPPGIVPTYIRPFAEPGFSLLVADEATLAGSGISGSARWDVPVADPPGSFAALEALTARHRAVQRDIGTRPDAIAAFEALSPTSVSVRVESGAFSIREEATAARRLLERPIGAGRTVGVAIAVAVVASAGVFLVRRRELEYRLLVGEGERWWRIAVRTTAQLVIPATVGSAVGIGGAALNARLAFPDASIAVLDVGWGSLVLVVGGSVVAAALASGFAAQATLDTGRLAPQRFTVWPAGVALAASIFLWVEIGRRATVGAATIDLVAVGLPLASLVAAVLTIVLVLDVVRRRVRRIATARRVGPVAFLAIRRTTSEQLGGRLTIAALGIGLGLFVVSWMLAATLERSAQVKASVVVGGETSMELLTHPPIGTALPPATTVVGIQTTRLVPGDITVTVVAVEPDTFAGAVLWPDEYGGGVMQLLESLTAASDAIPAVAVTGQPVPETGSFGTFQSFPYRVVDRYDGLPFASERGVTLLVSAVALDRFELDRLGLEPDTPGVDEIFFRPVRRYRPHLVSAGPQETLDAFVAGGGLVVRSVATRRDITDSVDAVAASAALGYLRLLGLVAAVVGVAALGLYLAMRRRATALATVLTTRMGLDPGRAALVTTIEAGLLAVVATIAGAGIAPLLSGRLVATFEPTAGLPPLLGIVVPAGIVVGTISIVVSLVAAVWLAERLGAGRPAGEVLRDS